MTEERLPFAPCSLLARDRVIAASLACRPVPPSLPTAQGQAGPSVFLLTSIDPSTEALGKPEARFAPEELSLWPDAMVTLVGCFVIVVEQACG